MIQPGIDRLFHRDIPEQLIRDIAQNSRKRLFWLGTVDSDRPILTCDLISVSADEEYGGDFPDFQQGDVLLCYFPDGADAEASRIAAALRRQGVGFYIVNNDLTDIRVLSEPAGIKEIKPLDLDGLTSFLGPTGKLAARSQYEERPQQQALLRFIAEGFNDGKLIVAEGSTGIGKSYAYLIPAVCWAAQNKKRVTISTATINLQQQLIEKDIPAVLDFTGLDLKAELVKGRGNYLCRWRLEQYSQEAEGHLTGIEETVELKSVTEWAKTSEEGSLSDLDFQPKETLWRQICGESDNCLGPRCQFYETCFIIKARGRAAAAQILVVNHHLLFADLVLRGDETTGLGYSKTAVLPPYDYLILDEAHNIEERMRSHLSQTLSKYTARHTLYRLYHKKQNREGGLWTTFRNQLPEIELPDVPERISGFQRSLQELEDSLAALLNGNSAVRIRVIPPPLLEQFFWPALQNARKNIQALKTACSNVLKILEKHWEEDEALLSEWRLLLKRFDAWEETCTLALGAAKQEDSGYVFWIEASARDPKRKLHRLVGMQLDLREKLQKYLYEPFRTVVMLSATLTIQNRFDYWLSRVGLDPAQEERLAYRSFPSPFNYREQVQLLLPNDAPSPSSGQLYEDYLVRLAAESLRANGGRSLLLFTSYSSLNYCYNRLGEELADSGLTLLRQGDDNNARLLRRFKDEESASLLATASFWEGVDAPGETLNLVLICRLPFRSPEDPIVAAYTEALTRQNRNSFMEYLLPEAIIRFKQGFGRLMRHSQDQGIVLVADPRITGKFYGRSFLESIPAAARTVTTTAGILRSIQGES